MRQEGSFPGNGPRPRGWKAGDCPGNGTYGVRSSASQGQGGDAGQEGIWGQAPEGTGLSPVAVETSYAV